LVVEDDRDLRELIAAEVRSHGHPVAEAENGLEALRWIERHGGPGFVLLDMRMPIMSGEDFLAELRKRPEHAKTPIALLTAAPFERFRRSPVVAQLRKPADLGLLHGLIDQHLRPCAPKSAPELFEPAPAIRVLCVEDDPDVAGPLGEILGFEGYQAELAGSCTGALDLLLRTHFDLLIVDYMLPDKSGAWLIQEGRRLGLFQDCPTILITAHPKPEPIPNTPVFKKPLEVDRFLDHLRRSLEPIRRAAIERPRPSLPPIDDTEIELVLYVDSASPLAFKVVRALHRLLEHYDPSMLRLRLRDVAEEPLAQTERVGFLPMLLLRRGAEELRIVGDLVVSSNIAAALDRLGARRR
jgi:CheY-like chemotaxis protein